MPWSDLGIHVNDWMELAGFVLPGAMGAARRARWALICALKEGERAKVDAAPDAFFYGSPRLVKHADSEWHETLTELYRERLPPNSAVLDMMSSWVSHLPEDMTFERVSGLGMNRQELANNTQLSDFVVRDLNADPVLPFEDASFDAVTCALSVQYLQKPEQVFAEMSRVLRPRGVAIVSFSNRMFFTKAINAWRSRSQGRGRLNLVKQYFQQVPEFTSPIIATRTSPLTVVAPQLAMFGLPYGGDPFYAVTAYKYVAPTEDEREQIRSGELRFVLATGKTPQQLREAFDRGGE